MAWETCEICKDVKATPNHLKIRHDMTYEEYEQKYLIEERPDKIEDERKNRGRRRRNFR